LITKAAFVYSALPFDNYIVASNDFLAGGGDGYRVFCEADMISSDYTVIGGTEEGGNLVYSDPGRWVRDVVVDYIKKKRMIAHKVENRIAEIR
jgi:5'-nucleotidase/UDP-sugar diphosphatase